MATAARKGLYNPGRSAASCGQPASRAEPAAALPSAQRPRFRLRARRRPRGMAAPSRKERQACWGARDEYWRCLDAHAEDAALCQRLRSSFEASCPQQWIKYFDKRRDYLKFKEKFEAGQFQPSESTSNS